MRSIIAALLLVFAATQVRAEDDPNYLYAEYIATARKGRPDCVVVNWAYAPKDEDNIDELKPERDSTERESRSDPGCRHSWRLFWSMDFLCGR